MRVANIDIEKTWPASPLADGINHYLKPHPVAVRSCVEVDAAFITSMIDHHQGAIDMAELAESRAEHDEIKQLSQDIIRAQEADIARMHDWQQEWGYDDSMDMGSGPPRR